MIGRRDVVVGGAALAATGLPISRAMASDRPPIVNRILLSENRVWIAAKVEGKGPYYFIVDSGGVLSFVEDSFAQQIGLVKSNGRQMQGLGGRVVESRWYTAKEVTLASGTRFEDMLFAGLPKRVSKDAVGSFGAGMFTTYDSDFDFVKGEWRIYRDRRPNFDGLKKIESRFTRDRSAQRIVAKAEIDGFEADMLMDTGAPGVSLNGRAAAASKLWDDSRPYAPMVAYGIGDAGVPSRIVRVKRIKVGPFVFEDMLVTLNRPGSLSGKEDGLLGLPILSQLHLTTQVAGNGALWAAPNGLKGEHVRYPLSGLWLDDTKGRVTIIDVSPGSPAAAAGLKVGDVVVGSPLGEVTRRLQSGPGTEVALRVERAGAGQDVRFTLRPFL